MVNGRFGQGIEKLFGFDDETSDGRKEEKV